MTSNSDTFDAPRTAFTAARDKPAPAGWGKRIFAAVNATGNKRHEAAVYAYKRDLFGPLRGEVLEIGPGAGNNLAYFSPHVQWTGIEPNPFMHRHLRGRAQRLGMEVELRRGTAERIDLPTGSVDAVACSLVLCSVRDVPTALAEIRRVLRPGGTFAFIEHVAAAGGTFARRAQKIMAPVNRLFGDGCQLERETWRDILDAGFAQVCIDHFALPLRLGGPHVAGYATTRV